MENAVLADRKVPQSVPLNVDISKGTFKTNVFALVDLTFGGVVLENATIEEVFSEIESQYVPELVWFGLQVWNPQVGRWVALNLEPVPLERAVYLSRSFYLGE